MRTIRFHSSPPVTSRSGITVVELGIALAILVLIAAISFPAVFRNRQRRQAARCAIQLETISAACVKYASSKGGMPARPEELVPDFLSEVPVCPAGGTYTLGTPQGDAPRCSVPGHRL